MTYGSAASAYRKTELVTSSDPKQLILMLYDGAIRFLEQARAGVVSGDIRRRGENLSKVLAIIGELNACLNMDAGGETAEFLRGLYMYMLTELPKVSLDNNIETVDKSMRYLKELKKLWEQRVMGRGEAGAEIRSASPSSEGQRTHGLSFAV
ncbi:flagellar export chaperone FliS [Desulforegula conservatrix]|uniref:flagellar export chaperone FliS n=1 Tax=Desulforegula conservatrix TaxID=153026 RepID=UPI000425817B|nr:flagellar export chaperone FliS [Desulforegula conservatrix]